MLLGELPSWSGARLDAGVGTALVASSSVRVLPAGRVPGGGGLVLLQHEAGGCAKSSARDLNVVFGFSQSAS